MPKMVIVMAQTALLSCVEEKMARPQPVVQMTHPLHTAHRKRPRREVRADTRIEPGKREKQAGKTSMPAWIGELDRTAMK